MLNKKVRNEIEQIYGLETKIDHMARNPDDMDTADAIERTLILLHRQYKKPVFEFYKHIYNDAIKRYENDSQEKNY